MSVAATVTVAPREISDLVYRVSRCAGCSSGTADLIAANVRFGEVFYGGAIEVFLTAVRNDALGPFIDAPDAVLTAEVDGAATVVFGAPVPLTAIAATIWQSALRGWAATGIDHGAVGAETLFESLAFTQLVPSGCREAVVAAERTRSVDGVQVSAEAFAKLYDDAKAFLVSEAVLDAAVPE